jgi:hypothetical protein
MQASAVIGRVIRPHALLFSQHAEVYEVRQDDG